MKKFIISILLTSYLFSNDLNNSVNVTVVKELDSNLTTSYSSDELVAQKLSQILRIIIIEVVSKNRYSSNKDLPEVSSVIKLLLDKKQASTQKSHFPNQNSSVKINIYSPNLKDICATIDTDDDNLIIDILPNGKVCRSLLNYLKSSKYTILK